MPELANQLFEKYIFKSSTVFNDLPENVKNAFLSKMAIKNYKKGQNIFIEGSYPAGIFFVKDGKVKKYKTLNGSKEQLIYIYNENELLGYAALLSEETYPDSAAAVTEAKVGFVSKENLMKLIEQYDELSKMLTKNLGHEFGVLINIITTFTQKTVRERVALTLLILNEKFKNNIDDNGTIQIVLTREDFANIVGTAVETLVRFLHEFKEESLIKTQGRKISVINKTKLLEIADISDS
jgi:CRP-like cAMP-binding protein